MWQGKSTLDNIYYVRIFNFDICTNVAYYARVRTGEYFDKIYAKEKTQNLSLSHAVVRVIEHACYNAQFRH